MNRCVSWAFLTFGMGVEVWVWYQRHFRVQEIFLGNMYTADEQNISIYIYIYVFRYIQGKFM